eukprot:3252685-Rhodomonas_salina.1
MFVGCEGKIVVWDVQPNLQQWDVKTRLLNHTHVLRAMSDGQQVLVLSTQTSSPPSPPSPPSSLL